MSRTPQNIIRIASPSDIALARWVSAFLEAEYGNKTIVFISPEKPHPFDNVDDFVDWKSKNIEKDGKKIQKITAYAQGNWICEFDRAITENIHADQFSLEPSQFEAEFWIRNRRPQQPTEDYSEELFLLVHKFFRRTSSDLIQANKNFSSAIASQIEKMGELSLNIAGRLSETQIQFDEQLRDRLRQLEVEGDARRSQLESEADARRQSLEAEYEERQRKLDEEENELKTRAKALDDRHATHVRRELRETITSAVQERLKLPAASRAIRRDRTIIQSICLIGMLFGGSISVVSLLELGTLSESLSLTSITNIFLAGRILVGSGLFVALLFYLLSFLRKSAHEDALFERANERYSLDINRASWVVETLVEIANENSDSSMPDELLRGITANLFESGGQEAHSDMNALEALGELMRKGVRLQVGSHGADIEVSPSAARRIGRDT